MRDEEIAMERKKGERNGMYNILVSDSFVLVV